MEPLLQSVLNFAVWGSLSSTVILGAFSFVQAAVDPPRRYRYLIFGLVMAYLGGLDLSRSLLTLDPLSYEGLRLLWSALYTGSVLCLLGFPYRAALATALGVLLLGFAAYRLSPAAATTITFPWAFGAVSLAFARRYWQGRGYASVILSAFSAAAAAMCACYLPVLNTQKPAAIILCYAQYAEISVIAVLMGWVHLPRELRGKAPVQMHPGLAALLFGAVVGSEALMMGAILSKPSAPELPILLGTLVQVASALAIYLYHRHQLVIHTDNVSQLLEERTAALLEAKRELAGQNEILAQRLTGQAMDLEAKNKDLQSKNDVIDRQRRLELAAQTAGQVAHDIQNLIAPLFTSIEALDEANTLNEIRGITKGFRQQVGRLLDLNTNLLALARRGRVELQPVHLNELVVEVCARFPGQRLSIESRGDAWVTGSSAQLARAVSNLLMNAFESDLDRLVPVTVRLGVVDVVQNRRCHLGFLGPGRHAYVEVQDEGPGIPPDKLDRIFEPFYSSKSGPHRSGSGLGLTIVSAVVDDHRGILDLDSRSGGTKFTLFFPAQDAPATGPESTRVSPNTTVLVVDDDTSVLGETRGFLEQAGYTVILSDNGARAIKILQAQDVDVVLLDLNMPRMSGLETFLGAMHLRPGIRAVVHSSHVTEEQEVKLKALGVTSVLQKPSGRQEILRALRQACDEREAGRNRKDRS